MTIEKSFRYSLLLEIYGKLLTDRQRSIMTSFLDKDISISELAKVEGITRQAVMDLTRRTMNILENFEDKLGLLKKYTFIQDKLTRDIGILKGSPVNTAESEPHFISEDNALKTNKSLESGVKQDNLSPKVISDLKSVLEVL